MSDWKPLNSPPKAQMGVLMYVPAARLDSLLLGADYAMEIGTWDGECFREQGTNHEVNERLWLNDGLYMPTHWMPLPKPPEARA